jgi:hypothetical protein
VQALGGTNAKKIYVSNLHEQIPKSKGCTIEDHVDALVRHDVVANVVPVDRRPWFASGHCSLPVHTAGRSGRIRMVHDVQKLTEAIIAEVRERHRRSEEQ